MITKALASDTREIYQMWKTMFAFDDGGSIDHYFKYHYHPENCYLIRQGNDIASSLSVHPHTINLNGVKIRASLISGVVTAFNYRQQGMMTKLMTEVLEELETQELVTLIQAYQPSIYEKFGFEMVYFRKKYHFTRNQISVYNTKGIGKEYEAEELAKLYQEFTAHFDGYYIRDVDYYQQYVSGIEAEKGKIIVYRDKTHKLSGYMIYYPDGDKIRIDEIIYQGSVALLKLINYALELSSVVSVTVSQAENLGKIIPTAIEEPVEFMMARVNDYSLFNRLYNSNAHTVKEAFGLNKKPLYIHEYW